MGSYKKKLFIVLLLFLLISCFVCSSVNAGMSDIQYTVEQPILLKQQQEYLASIFLRKFDSVASDQFKTNLRNMFDNVNYWPYFTYNTGSQGSAYIFVYFIPSSIQYQLLDTYLVDTENGYFEDVFFLYPVSGYQFDASDINVSYITRYYVQVQGNAYGVGAYTNNIFLPSSVIMYQNQNCINYINGINPYTSPWSMLQAAIKDNTEAVEDTTQAVNNLRNDFNEEESDSDYDFPTSNPTTDPTSSGIDNIFNMFYMRINSWNALGINVPIPFTGKSFTINPDITENIINGWTPSTQIATVFKTLLSGVWYYLLGRYIVKDVQHYVDGLQTGDILTKSDTNIKTEML